MRCVICRLDFDFDAGQTAVVLRHVAYGFDFAHSGACEQAALDLLFPEPAFDCAAFAHDVERRAVLRLVAPCVALIEYHDRSHGVERVARDVEWIDEPGAAEFCPVGDSPRVAELAA